jgi:hypothetical protein
MGRGGQLLVLVVLVLLLLLLLLLLNRGGATHRLLGSGCIRPGTVAGT